MELHKLYSRMLKLEEHATFGADCTLTDSEFGPFCQDLSRISQTESGIELVFGEDKEVTLSQAIATLEPLVESIPDAIVYQCHEGVKYPLKRVYEDVPVFIMECDIRYEEE